MEHPGSPEGGNITQGDSGAGSTWAAPTTVGGGDPLETGGAPNLSGTLSPAAPNLTLGTAADGAVAPGRNGVHPSETGGSPDIPRNGGPNDSNLALGTAANGAVTQGRPEFIPSGRDLQSLLPPSRGSQQSIPT